MQIRQSSVAKILNRYKRFFADVEQADGTVLTVHTTNTGPMKTCWEPGWPCVISRAANPNRKLTHTLEMTYNGETWIGVNTHAANQLVGAALTARQIPELTNYLEIIPEYKVGNSRIDFYLSGPQACFVEVKSVTFREQRSALFPDTVSVRATKHLQELISLKQAGHRAVIFFLVQREDVEDFAPAAHLDPVYAETFRQAQAAGVEVLVYGCQLNPQEIVIKRTLPVRRDYL